MMKPEHHTVKEAPEYLIDIFPEVIQYSDYLCWILHEHQEPYNLQDWMV